MAIKYKDVRRLVRFKEQDNNEILYSDYDIKMAVNEVLRYLSSANANSNADFNEKTKVYDQEQINQEIIESTPEQVEPELIDFAIDGVELPDDFVAIVSIQGKPSLHGLLTPCLSIDVPKWHEYKVVGNKIYCGQHYFTLAYKCSLAEVSRDEDEIELPYLFTDHLVQLVRMVLKQTEDDIMRDAVDNALQDLIPKRRYRNAKISMPFRIGW